jgi:hypothetical protein
MLPKPWTSPAQAGEVVEERSVRLRRCRVSGAGGIRNENAGMSSDNEGEKPSHRKSKVSWARFVLPG